MGEMADFRVGPEKVQDKPVPESRKFSKNYKNMSKHIETSLKGLPLAINIPTHYVQGVIK